MCPTRVLTKTAIEKRTSFFYFANKNKKNFDYFSPAAELVCSLYLWREGKQCGLYLTYIRRRRTTWRAGEKKSAYFYGEVF